MAVQSEPLPHQANNLVVKFAQCFAHEMNIGKEVLNSGQGNLSNGLQLHQSWEW